MGHCHSAQVSVQIPAHCDTGRPTDLTTKTYVDGLSYLTAGTGITKSGSSLSVNSSAITSVGTLTGLTSSGIVTISNATAAINTSTGALRVTGGASFGGNLFAVGNITAASPTATGHLCTKSYVDGLSYIAVGTGLVKSGNTISLGSDFALKSELQSFAYKSSLTYAEVTGKPDLTIYETKTALKELAYKDKVDYATDVINAPALVTYGSGLLFSENTVSLNPAVSVDSLATVGGISVGGNMSAVGNVSIGGTLTATKNANIVFNHILNNQSAASNSCTSLHLHAGGTQGLYLHINSAGRGVYGGTSAGTVQNYAGSLRLLTRTETGGIVIDDVGDVDISQRLSVGMGNDIVPFPPLNLWANTGVVSARPYGNGTYVVSSSSKFSNSTQYDPWHAFTDNSSLYPWYPLNGTYNANNPFNYVGSTSTIVDEVEVLGEWIQLQLSLPILLESFDIAVLNVGSEFYINEFALVGSNDGTTFTQLMTSTLPWGPVGAQTVNVPIPNVSKAFKTYRLIIKSLLGNRTYCQVSRLIFNGKPVSMDIRGAISAKHVITENLQTSGLNVETLKANNLDVTGNISIGDNLSFKDDAVDTQKHPTVPLTGETTTIPNVGAYIANASSNRDIVEVSYRAFTSPLTSYDVYYTGLSTYSGSEQNMYVGAVATTVDGTNIKGEYVDLEVPKPISLKAFSIAGLTANLSMFPKSYMVCASNDRTSWSEIVSGTLDWTTQALATQEKFVPVRTPKDPFKVFRFIIRSVHSATYGQIGRLAFYGASDSTKVIQAPAVKVNNTLLNVPSFAVFQLAANQTFVVNGTAYQLITKWTPLSSYESDRIVVQPNTTDILFMDAGVYNVDFDLECYQTSSVSVTSYIGLRTPGNSDYFEDQIHSNTQWITANQRVRQGSIVRILEPSTLLRIRFNSGSSSGGIRGGNTSRLSIYRIAPLV